MLEQLDKIGGVRTSSANYAGTMIRVTLNGQSQPAQVADAVHAVLSESGTPKRLTGPQFAEAIADEEWRSIDRIGELSAIEFRTLAIQRLKRFADDEQIDPETTEKLLKIAAQEWDRLAVGFDVTIPPHIADWRGQCRKVAHAFLEKARALLTQKQYEQLKAATESELGK